MFSQNSVAALATEFEKLSRIMGAKDTNTTFSGDGAYTDGRTINLPAMDMTADVDPTHQAIMRGYHIHEVAHVTDTDFETAKKRKAKHLHRIWNCCEDVFIERKAMEKYAGAQKNLEATIEHVLSEENKHWADNPEENEARLEKWWQEIPYAALQQARKDMGYESQALDEYLGSLPPELKREARRYAKSMIETQNSGEAYKLAGVINRRMNALGKAHEEEEEEQQQPQVPTGAGPSPQGDGDGEPQQPPAQGQESRDEEGDDDGAGAGDGDEGDSEQQGERKGFTLEGAEEREKGSMGDVFGKYQAGNADVETRFAQVFDDHQDVWNWLYDLSRNIKDKGARDVVEKHWKQPCNMKAYVPSRIERARKYISNDVNQYAARLARLLLAQEDRRNEGGYVSGRVDRRRLAQLIAGNTNIFARPKVTRTAETRIMVAVDGSSSMEQSLTSAAILAVNDCLGRANVRFDVTEWGGLEIRDFKAGAWVVRHKQAHQSYKRLASTLQFQPVGGGTPTYAALLPHAQIMSEGREPRRVLFFLTDGEPDGYYNGECAMCKDLVTRMERDGIEVYGVGIQARGGLMDNMFSKYVETNFANLGKTLLGGLEKLLLEEGHAHAA